MVELVEEVSVKEKVVTESGIVTLVNAVVLKAEEPIVSTECLDSIYPVAARSFSAPCI